MIRKCTDEDISDEELDKVINPFYDNYHEYIITYVIPEVIAFYIASSYSRNAMYGYKNKRPYLDTIANVKLKNFNIEVYERWRQYINSCNISTRYKNDIYKFLKSLLNYATDWYGFSFVHVYRKMHNFNNPNELPKEMLYFTYDEFQKFLSVEKDIKFRCACNYSTTVD